MFTINVGRTRMFFRVLLNQVNVYFTTLYVRGHTVSFPDKGNDL